MSARWLILAVALTVPGVAAARPAATTVAPAKTAKPGHGKKPPTPEAPTQVVEPWTQSPRYGAPWKAMPAPINATPKGATQRVSGSVFEFFFWVFAVLAAVVVGAAVSARVRAKRLGPWEARGTASLAGAKPTPQPEETAPKQ